MGAFEQIAAVLFVCVVAGALATLLRQPLLVGLIAAGIAVGPEALGLVEATEEIELLAEIGIALLLFVVGLKLDVRLVQRLGPVALATGLGQVIFTSAFGYLIATLLGFATVQAIYIAVALTFSSTIIIVKLLTDKRELDELHGRIALGFLIVQDIVVVLAMIAITAAGDTGEGGLAREFAGIALRGVLLLLAVAAIGTWVLPRVTHLLARQSELLVLAAVTWAVGLAALTHVLGFSSEVGAFLAGMSLASTSYREALSGRLSTLRDFLLVFFFIQLGTSFELTAAAEQIPAALLFSLFVLVGNPIIVLVIMGLLGYRKKVAFKAGLTVAQISEFSLILVALGAAQGHVGTDVIGLVTAVGLITITASTYLIYGSDRIYARIEPLLRVFERRRPTASIDFDERTVEPSHVVIGLGRFGRTVCAELEQRGDDVLGVDWDPRSIRDDWSIPVLYGDAEDPDLPEQLPLQRTRWVVSTLRGRDTNLALVQALRRHGYRGRIAVAADDEGSEQALVEGGADLAIRPLHVAAGPLLERLHDDA
ncbi:cation:proton antiporter [Egicoccus halophilus]|uniref:Potassium efflux system protein n=1 Tax=Egicoccus halophilus TaxID=1670830 RepID=A0A8J3EVA3_9ACTN|nr:cation:proton antiporter family protein [Egicoccus halophilus]GGI07714.1 potassium efflux system protein [Egicoccus halophilus]